MQEVKTRTNQPVSGVDKLVEQAIQADKDIISQIKMYYWEDGDYTDIIFPKGVMPLSITLNTHTLFLKDNSLVDRNGNEVEGYEYIDYDFDTSGTYLSISGNISEQTINALVYINETNKEWAIPVIRNTYNLFYPASGTKLYKHYLEFSDGTNHIYLYFVSNQNYTLTLEDFTNYTSKVQNILNGAMLNLGYSNLAVTLTNMGNKGQFTCYSVNGTSIASTSVMTSNVASVTHTVTEL